MEQRMCVVRCVGTRLSFGLSPLTSQTPGIELPAEGGGRGDDWIPLRTLGSIFAIPPQGSTGT